MTITVKIKPCELLITLLQSTKQQAHSNGIDISCTNGECPPGYGCKGGKCVKGYKEVTGYERVQGKIICPNGLPAVSKTVSISNNKYKYTFTTNNEGIYSGEILSEPGSMYQMSVDEKRISVNGEYKSARILIADIAVSYCLVILQFMNLPCFGFADYKDGRGNYYITQVVEVTGLDCPNAKEKEKQANDLFDYVEWRYKGCLTEWAKTKIHVLDESKLSPFTYGYYNSYLVPRTDRLGPYFNYGKRSDLERQREVLSKTIKTFGTSI